MTSYQALFATLSSPVSDVSKNTVYCYQWSMILAALFSYKILVSDPIFK